LENGTYHSCEKSVSSLVAESPGRHDVVP